MEMNIVVPSLGESVVEATVARWLKKEGDRVDAGETLVELETDKVNLEVGAERPGILSQIVRQTGEDVKIGDLLGVLSEATASAVAPSTGEKTVEQQKTGEKAKATPSARKWAQEQGVDLNLISGTGSGNQITRQDVETYVGKKQPKTEPVVTEVTRTERREERVRMSRRRQTIARRLVEAQQTAAMLTTYNEVDMSHVLELRSRHKESFRQRYGVNLGIASFFVKAAIGALKEFPPINAEIQGNDIVFKYYYDIGVAIGAVEGLVVPVLRDANRLSFAEIEKAIKEYAAKSEAGTLTLEELRGGTFTITNGGVFGSLLSTPILNPPQAAILGLHKIEERPVAVQGQVVVRPMMYVALSYDHRLVDGRESVQFLSRVKALIEDPASLLF